MDLGLAGANVVVAGGTKGMGLAAAECFAEDGANVAVLARAPGPLDEALASLRAFGSPDPLAIPTDLSDAASIEAAFATIGERWGGVVNSLVNAVGPEQPGEHRAGHRRRVVRGDGDRRAERSPLRALVPPDAARRGVGPHRQRVGALDEASDRGPHRVHRGEGGDDEHQQEPVAAPRAGGDPGEHRLAGHLPVGGPAQATSSRCRPSATSIPTNLYDAMRAISEDFGHPAQMPRAGDPKEIGAVIAFVGSRRNSYMTGANINVDGGSDFT